jgi:hypothetical protein
MKTITSRALIVTVYGCLSVFCLTAGNTVQVEQDAENPLLGKIREEFQRKNPEISEVSLVEISPFYRPGPAEKYVLVAWGIAGREAAFKGDFWDEVFGFFVADGKLTRLEETLDIVPTPRWRDYSFTIDRISNDSIRIRGAGDTYGDTPRLLEFKWDPFKAKRFRRSP